MAKTNYHQIRRTKEATRKGRQQSKLDRRARKSDDAAVTVASVDSTAAVMPVQGPDDATT